MNDMEEKVERIENRLNTLIEAFEMATIASHGLGEKLLEIARQLKAKGIIDDIKL